jgi:hypothetical protein
MNAPAPKPSAPPHEAPPEVSLRLPPRLRIALWRLQLFGEMTELAIAEALIEAALPGSLGDHETHNELERAQIALFHLGNYILCRVGRWGGAE